MTTTDIQTRLREFILRQFPAAQGASLTDDAALLDQGLIDSLGVLEIVSFIEEQFSVTLTDDDLVSESFSSIAAMAQMVSRKLESQSSFSA